MAGRCDRLQREARTGHDLAVGERNVRSEVLIAAGIEPVDLADWLRSRGTITPRHLDHIPVAKRGVPGIFVVITVAPGPGAPMSDFGILIDGSHRAALALREGRDFYAYLLTEQEQRSICTYTVEGKVTEIPQIAAGPGITPEDAGL